MKCLVEACRYQPIAVQLSRLAIVSPVRYFELASRRFAFSAASLPGYLAIRLSRVFLAAVFLPISCWLLAMLSIASGPWRYRDKH